MSFWFVQKFQLEFMPEIIATRDAYGKTLAEVGGRYPEIVVLDADLSVSTKTAVFAKQFPHRFFNMGVAEQDLMGTAAGLALSGKHPFVSTFAVFATGRAWEIIRQSIAYPHLNVKICASHAGLTVGEDGASHQTIADVALMRVLPGMTVLVPADPFEAAQMVEVLAKHEGPAYLRLSRAKSPQILPDDYRFEIGKAFVLRSGSDVALFACGLMVLHAMQAADLLEKQGVSAAVVNVSTIKPLDVETLLGVGSSARAVFVLEEHSILGGLGSAVTELFSERNPKPVYRIGVQDQFGQSGSAEELLKHYHLMPEDIVRQVLQCL